MPDLEHSGVDSVLVTRWTSDDPETAVVEALVGTKPEGLVSASGYAGFDGTSALVFEQWRGSPVERRGGAVEYRRYRGAVRPDAPAVGCVVVVEVEFADGVDPEVWIDLVFDALESDENPAEGGISAHFHVSTDGRRALNYAEWTSEAAHVAALANSGQGTVGSGEKWLRVKEYPGVVDNSFTRFRLVREV
jgi:hypothetical protein